MCACQNLVFTGAAAESRHRKCIFFTWGQLSVSDCTFTSIPGSQTDRRAFPVPKWCCTDLQLYWDATGEVEFEATWGNFWFFWVPTVGCWSRYYRKVLEMPLENDSLNEYPEVGSKWMLDWCVNPKCARTAQFCGLHMTNDQPVPGNLPFNPHTVCEQSGARSLSLRLWVNISWLGGLLYWLEPCVPSHLAAIDGGRW